MSQRSRDNRYENQGNNLNVPKMHFEVKETYIESPQYAEAITLPRQPDLAYSNNGSNYSVSSQHHRTVNEAYIPEPVMQQGITIPRPVKKYKLPPIDPKDLPPVPNNKPPAQQSFKSVETKESLLSNDITSKSARRQDVGKSIMMFLEDNKKNCMYGCIPVNKRKRTICMSVTGAFLLIFGIVMFLYFPRMPDFEVLDIKVPPGNSFTLTPVNLASEDLDFKFTLQMNMNISVINSNRYQMTIQSLKVSAFIMANISELNSQTPSSAERLFGKVVANRLKVDESNNKQLIGRGSRNTPLVFLPGKPFLFSMDFLVAYSPNKKFGNAVNDPALNEIIQLCVEAPLRPDFNRTSTIRYEAEAEISGLPFKPLLSGELKINCPFQGSARQKLLAAIKGQSSSGIESTVPVDDAPTPAEQPNQVNRAARMTTKNIIFSEAVLPKDFIVKMT